MTVSLELWNADSTPVSVAPRPQTTQHKPTNALRWTVNLQLLDLLWNNVWLLCCRILTNMTVIVGETFILKFISSTIPVTHMRTLLAKSYLPVSFFVQDESNRKVWIQMWLNFWLSFALVTVL